MQKVLLSTVLCGVLALGANAGGFTKSGEEKGFYLSIGNDTFSAGGNSESDIHVGFGGDYMVRYRNKFMLGFGSEAVMEENYKIFTLDGKFGYKVKRNIGVYGLLGYAYGLGDSDYENQDGFGLGFGGEYKPSARSRFSVVGEFKKYSFDHVDWSRLSLKLKYSF